MSIVLDASADALQITSSPLDASNPYLYTQWVRLSSIGGNYQTLFSLEGADYHFFAVDPDGHAYVESGAGGNTGSMTLVTGEDYYIACRRVLDGVTHRIELLINNSIQATVTATDFAASRMHIGHFGGGHTANAMHGSTAYNKAWQGNKNDAFVLAEMSCVEFVDDTGAYGRWDFAGGSLTDQSGNGHNWTSEGTLTTGPNPDAADVDYCDAPTEITGELNKSLRRMTLSAAGTLPIQGAANVTLRRMSAAIAGQLPITGVSNGVLRRMTLAATGTVAITGSMNATLRRMTLQATGGEANLFEEAKDTVIVPARENELIVPGRPFFIASPMRDSVIEIPTRANELIVPGRPFRLVA